MKTQRQIFEMIDIATSLLFLSKNNSNGQGKIEGKRKNNILKKGIPWLSSSFDEIIKEKFLFLILQKRKRILDRKNKVKKYKYTGAAQIL